MTTELIEHYTLEQVEKLAASHPYYGRYLSELHALINAAINERIGELVAHYIPEKDLSTTDHEWAAEYPDLCQALYTLKEPKP